ncbi:hypothetical protein ACI2JA_19650 [Alkalihalobacillus sp. NPDC078783]|uniref:hypothetical protein n=1 Tax=Streptomyces albidoflavus TaxID=1886 RepID=UPI0033E9A778
MISVNKVSEITDYQHYKGEPIHVHSIGTVHQIKIKDYDKFEELHGWLLFEKEDFNIESENHTLFELICASCTQNATLAQNVEELIKLVMKVDEIDVLIDHVGSAITYKGGTLHSGNYETFRELVLKQAVVHKEPRYKNEHMKKWFEMKKQLWAKEKKNDIDLIAKFTTITTFSGRSMDDLMDYTILQFEFEFDRVNRIILFERNSHVIGHGDVPSSHFAEKFDIFRNPYDDWFRKESDVNIL